MLTEPRVINVLGTNVHVHFRVEKEDPKLVDCDGYFDHSESLIVVKIPEASDDSIGNTEAYQKKVLRHEIIHAFLYESGMDWSSGPAGAWAVNEEMVDWFAIQSPKIFKVFREQRLVI